MAEQSVSQNCLDLSRVAVEFTEVEAKICDWKAQLSELISSVEALEAGLSTQTVTENMPRPSLRVIQDALRQRATRARFFGDDLFHDPAWDMLLDLYAAHIEQKRVSITSVCMASGVPTTTALRWLNALERRQLINKANDPNDGRRIFVALSPQGLSSMDSYFASCRDRSSMAGAIETTLV